MKAIVRAAAFALVFAAGSAAAQPAAPRPDTVFREIEADTFAAIMRASGMTDVTVRDQREETPIVDFKARNGVEVSSRLVNCQRGNHPTRCRVIAFSVCWTRAQFGRDLPDPAALNTYNVPRLAGWAVLDPRGTEPRVCMRHAHVVQAGSTAANMAQSVTTFVAFIETFRRQFPAQGAQPAPAQPAPAQTPATPAPATPPAQ
jgi:hypothetical protein